MDLNPVDQPLLFLIIALAVMLLTARIGLHFRRRRGAMSDDEREDLNLVLTSALTLLALIIGFSFSMAVGRYDQRKNDEATEANTIQTEYLRVGMLSSADTAGARDLLRQYIRQRIATYEAPNADVLLVSGAPSEAIQRRMWVIVEKAAEARQNSITALVAAGMNDVIDAQGYVAAAWSNRIPPAAWALMFAIALSCCLLIGYDSRIRVGRVSGHLILPVLIAISFFLIADLDSTHAGFIRVTPDNLITAAQSIEE
jgi:hypothetical protein